MDVYHARSLDLHVPQQGKTPPPPPRILDVGACTGIFSALCLAAFPEATVVAVEPDPENLELLHLNTARHRNRCEIIAAAVGAHAGSTVLFGSHGQGHTQHDAISDDNGTPVTQITLGSLLTEPAALVKIDVEGSEFDLLAACPEIALARADRIHMELHGTREAPWVDDAPRRYGEMMTKLAYTHTVQVFGSPADGGYAYCTAYDR
jgi:FkbM family methyltransferase